MKKHSAGLLIFRVKDKHPEVLLAHMGTPWWAKKDIGAWTIPKGVIEKGENAIDTAKREFTEELGMSVPEGKFIELGTIDQQNKTVSAWALEADLDITNIKSNNVSIEWPPKSGKNQDFPEVDRASWFSLGDATTRVVKGQAELIERLAAVLNTRIETNKVPQQSSLF